MSRAAKPPSRTLGDVLGPLGDVPPARVCFDPPPGRAGKRDLLRLTTRTGKLFELVNRTLVEKPMGFPESHIGMELGYHLRDFLAKHPLGYLAGADALIELLPDLVRGPDVCFVSWAGHPERTVPTDAISKQVPDLAVEVLSPSNTRREMAIKLKEYFLAGVRLVWLIDPATRTAEAYTAPGVVSEVPAGGTLDGGDVLQGFRLPLAQLFEMLANPATPKKPRKKK